MLLANPHELSNKSFQMKNNFRPIPNPMLEKCTPSDDICFQSIIYKWNEFECKRLEYCSWRNAVREEVVEFGANSEDLGGGVLAIDVVGDGADEGFPVRRWNWCCV